MSYNRLIKLLNEEFNQDVCPEIRLWRRVLLQALLDAAKTSQRKKAKTWKMQAIYWLKNKPRDFIDVCRLADLEIEKISPIIDKFLEDPKFIKITNSKT